MIRELEWKDHSLAKGQEKEGWILNSKAAGLDLVAIPYLFYYLMNYSVQPIYLFSDSQLLFWKKDGKLFLRLVAERCGSKPIKAAYIGASNGDDPRFYSIFEAAMEGAGIQARRSISSSFMEADRQFMTEADIILLAGGDVERGWKVFESVGLKELIVKRYLEGAVLIGISAGAVQLGLYGWQQNEHPHNAPFDTFKLVPFIIDAHAEAEGWERLQEQIKILDGKVKGVGIPAGGGMIYYPDRTIEPIRYPVYEFSLTGEEIAQSLLLGQAEER